MSEDEFLSQYESDEEENLGRSDGLDTSNHNGRRAEVLDSSMEEDLAPPQYAEDDNYYNEYHDDIDVILPPTEDYEGGDEDGKALGEEDEEFQAYARYHQMLNIR